MNVGFTRGILCYISARHLPVGLSVFQALLSSIIRFSKTDCAFSCHTVKENIQRRNIQHNLQIFRGWRPHFGQYLQVRLNGARLPPNIRMKGSINYTYALSSASSPKHSTA